MLKSLYQMTVILLNHNVKLIDVYWSGITCVNFVIWLYVVYLCFQFDHIQHIQFHNNV